MIYARADGRLRTRQRAVLSTSGAVTTRTVAKILFHLVSDVDKDSLCPKPFHGHFQTLGARSLHQLREKEPIGHLLAGRRRFLSSELLVIVLTCTKVMADATCGTVEHDGSERVHNAAGAEACGVASVGEGVCLGVATGTGIRHEECGSAWSGCKLGRRRS